MSQLNAASCCYIGSGIAYLAPYDAWQAAWPDPHQPTRWDGSQTLISPAMRDIGEVSRIDIDVRTTTQSLPLYTGCGGEQCSNEQCSGRCIDEPEPCRSGDRHEVLRDR